MFILLAAVLGLPLLGLPARLAWIGHRDSTSHRHRLAWGDARRLHSNRRGHYYLRRAEA